MERPAPADLLGHAGPVLLRDATAGDRDLLERLLVEAFAWASPVAEVARLDVAQVLADPHVGGYVAGWPRAGDIGVVAQDGGRPLGGAWARLMPADAPGYGFVAADVPELSLAVLPGSRGRGVGRAVLSALVERAVRDGRRALSLSVGDGNTAARTLYELAGFRVVGRVGTSDTMLLDLSGPEGHHA